MAKYDSVIVTWHDAHAEPDWMEVGDIDNEPFVVESVGMLIPDAKDDHVVIAQSVGVHDDVDSVLSIPCGMVVKVQILAPKTIHVKEDYPQVILMK